MIWIFSERKQELFLVNWSQVIFWASCDQTIKVLCAVLLSIYPGHMFLVLLPKRKFFPNISSTTTDLQSSQCNSKRLFFETPHNKKNPPKSVLSPLSNAKRPVQFEKQQHISKQWAGKTDANQAGKTVLPPGLQPSTHGNSNWPPGRITTPIPHLFCQTKTRPS